MEFELTTLVVIGTNCTGSCESSYHTTIISARAPTVGKDLQLSNPEKMVQSQVVSYKAHSYTMCARMQVFKTVKQYKKNEKNFGFKAYPYNLKDLQLSNPVIQVKVK
jgi:hypothetical protein